MSLESTVLHQCIRPRVGAHAPDHHGNPRASNLITGHASKGYSGHQFSMRWKTFSPFLLFLSQTSVGNSDCRAHMTLLAMSADSLRLERGPERSDLEVATAGQDAPTMRAILLAGAEDCRPLAQPLFGSPTRSQRRSRTSLIHCSRCARGALLARPGGCAALARVLQINDEVVLRGRQT
jgi:hypothetical protein